MKQLSYSQTIVLKWYKENPANFDTASNNDWFLLYSHKWLGVQYYNLPFIQDRMKKMPYETFRRAVQWLINHGYIKLSPENMKTRHRKENTVREEMRDKPNNKKETVIATYLVGNTYHQVVG